MNIDIKRILAVTTLLAAGSALAAGCVIKSDDDDDDDGPGGAGGVGASGGRGGSAGSAGSGGSAGTYGGAAGTAGWDGGAGSAGTGGDSSVCFGNTRTTDASLSGACERLPYFDRDCGGVMPLAADVCLTMESRARPAVFEEYLECIQQLPDDATVCNDAGFQVCEEAVFPKACLRTISFNTGGWSNNSADCTKMNARCPDLSVSECQSYLSALTDEGARAAFFCWDPSSRASDGGVNPECYDAFRECFFLEAE
jgi:hypothetical protein